MDFDEHTYEGNTFFRPVSRNERPEIDPPAASAGEPIVIEGLDVRPHFTSPCVTCGVAVGFVRQEIPLGGPFWGLVAIDPGAGSDQYEVWCKDHTPERYKDHSGAAPLALGDVVRYRYGLPHPGRVRDAQAGLYGVAWDDEPELVSRWYTRSMLLAEGEER